MDTCRAMWQSNPLVNENHVEFAGFVGIGYVLFFDFFDQII